MEGNYLTTGDLAMWDASRSQRYYPYEGCYQHKGGRGTATTAIGLAAGLGGGALLLAVAAAWGVNQASKARYQGAESAMAAQSKTMELIAATVNREASRSDGITVDVQQTLRSLASQTSTALAQGGSAASNALATAEAYALLNNSNGTGLNSAVGGCNYLRVARVSGSRLCGCDGCGSDS
jgi:hypothetical protein